MPVSDTKSALLNSAESAARRFGFDGFSYADLAEDVGIRKASIHHHFPSKAKLSIALMERYHQTFKETCADIDATFATGGGKLTALVERYRVGSDNGNQLCLCTALSACPDSLAPDVVKQIIGFRGMVTQWIANAFEKGRADGSISGISNPTLEASSALSLLEGAQLAARVVGDPAAFDAAITLLTMRMSN